MAHPNRKVHVTSYGCQMNVYDSQKMVDILAKEGYAPTQNMEEADVIILNTCHIREKASDKVFSELGKVRLLKEERAARGLETFVTVAGCVAQAEGKEIIRRQPSVDIVVGPQTYHRLPDLLQKAKHTHPNGIVETDFPLEDKFDHLVPPSSTQIRTRGVSAFVTIQEGCDKFCTFCVVPYTRGAEMSRPVSQILQEVTHFAQAGVREITFLGQNVNAYHGEGLDETTWTLAQLLQAAARIEGIARIRYTTSHPRDMGDDLIAAHGNLEALMPFLHLPVQSGSDRILAAMNRKHRVQEYIDMIAHVRQHRPDIALSSDFIVGFPGESDEDFEQTLDLIETIRFASVFSFKYSARPGTPAADLPDQIPEDVRKTRLARLQDVVEHHRQAFNRAQIGEVLDVLFEKPGRHEGQVAGKSPYLQPVQVEGPLSFIGQIIPVKILDVGTNSLFGQALI